MVLCGNLLPVSDMSKPLWSSLLCLLNVTRSALHIIRLQNLCTRAANEQQIRPETLHH